MLREKFYSFISIGWLVAIFSLSMTLVSFAQTEKTSTNSQFNCPVFQKLGQPLYILDNRLGTNYSLEYHSLSKNSAPPENTIESAWRYFLVQAEPLIQSQFGLNSLPQKIIVIATDQIAPMTGLFCVSAQKDSNAMTIYTNPEIGFTPTDLASAIAHEFVHSYFYRQKIKEPLWFEEGLHSFLNIL